MIDYTQVTYKIEFDKGERRITKYYHNQLPLKRRYAKEINNNPILYFCQDGKWFGLDT